jgi:cysteinyl-tRNA synthetase
MSGTPVLKLYNTLTRTKEPFVPIDPENVRMYVCGPTVYDFAHIGNARPVIVFDVLNRLLRHVYGEKHVTYVRNITDVDDKINARALRDFGPEIAAGTLSLNDAIRRVTEKTANQFQQDVAALGCLAPDHQPRATEHIPGMVEMTQALIDRGHAYVAKGNEGREVLFDVASMPDYGKLSNRRIEDQQAGARVAVEGHKKNPGDFVLWKESLGDLPGWPAHFHFNGGHFGIHGRPGWHIECSVMSKHHLGEVFDIHGGGLDLIFPHHENEIAQSCCAHGTPVMANIWMHNGFLQLEGKKMSKSDGNFVTIDELLNTTKFGGRRWPGEVLRLAMLMTHYREPIDFSVRRLEEAEALLNKWRRWIASHAKGVSKVDSKLLDALADDLNTPSLFRLLSSYSTDAAGVWFSGGETVVPSDIGSRQTHAAQFLAGALAILGIQPEMALEIDEKLLAIEVQNRLAFLAAKKFAEADRIRDELTAQGIQLMDYKDPETGERRTKWEVKR